MKRIARAAALVGVGVLVARTLAPKLHERIMARCERMFQQLPEDSPPKRMIRGVEEIRVNTARTVELLEERRPAAETEPPSEVSSIEAVGHAA